MLNLIPLHSAKLDSDGSRQNRSRLFRLTRLTPTVLLEQPKPGRRHTADHVTVHTVMANFYVRGC